ncbi:AAA family ATPase [Enterococcus faecalis]|nr:AAA family ATPase [Enterococcus faecalis]MCS5459413.1 AAA family ATPase [Enterococcus faecalis]UJQ90483.1 AAA family ATPase [Enterococcus faecalis]
MSKNGKVISIINMKGGVGKTALSVGISSFLSEKKMKKYF